MYVIFFYTEITMKVDLQFRAQSFTSLMADRRQDINGGFAHLAGALMEHFLEGSAPLRLV